MMAVSRVIPEDGKEVNGIVVTPGGGGALMQSLKNVNRSVGVMEKCVLSL